LGKKQKNVSFPLDTYEELDALFDQLKDVCKELEIGSTAELVRVLANLGKPRFLQIAQEVRTSRKMKEKAPTQS